VEILYQLILTLAKFLTLADQLAKVALIELKFSALAPLII
jgi:hypothetical protein